MTYLFIYLIYQSIVAHREQTLAYVCPFMSADGTLSNTLSSSEVYNKMDT